MKRWTEENENKEQRKLNSRKNWSGKSKCRWRKWNEATKKMKMKEMKRRMKMKKWNEESENREQRKYKWKSTWKTWIKIRKIKM